MAKHDLTPHLVLFLLLAITPWCFSATESTPTAANSAAASAVVLSEAERDWLRNHPNIRIGVDPEFHPYEFVAQDGSFAGIASDYVKTLNQRLGTDMQMVPDLSWSEVVARSERREIDALSAVGMTEERREYLNFSSAYLSFDRVIIARNDAPFISGLEDVWSWRLGVQSNTSHEGFLRDHTTIVPSTYETLESAIMALSEGEIDALVGNIGSATYWIRELNITNLRVATPVTGGQQRLHFAVRKDWPMLLSIINKGLASISPTDQQRIRQRWFSIDYEVGIPTQRVVVYILQVVAVALAILLIFFGWNYRLKQEIGRRKRAVEELVQSEVKYRDLFNSSPDAILVADENGFIDCNSAALKLYRCPDVEAFRHLDPDALSVPIQSDGQDSTALKKEMVGLAYRHGIHRFEWDSMRTDGTQFQAEVTMSTLKLQGRRVIQILVQDITERLKAQDQIKYLANHDALTGLPSLRLFQDRLQTALARARRNQNRLAVLFLDLDGFKAINDAAGHAAGDQVLKVVADRMLACIRRPDTVARSGGDEFVILLPETDTEDGARTTAQKVIDKANLAIQFEGDKLQVGASIGIALFPDHGDSAETLMKQADHAMYRAKADGKNTYRLAQQSTA